MAENRSWLRPAVDRQSALWLLALLFYGVGDSATTFAGMSDDTAAEAGPVAVHVLGHGGIEALLALKVGLFVVCFGVWYAVRTPGRVAIPLGFVVAGVLVAAWKASSSSPSGSRRAPVSRFARDRRGRSARFRTTGSRFR